MKGSDYNLERDIYLSIPAGRVPYAKSINKFGYAPDGVQTTITDIWDRANAAATQQIWLQPLAGVVHNIVSTDVADDVTGAGLKKLQIYGLTDWDTKEVSEVVEMNGTTDVPTVNEYVIIHRMVALEYGAVNVNVGTITATTDDISAYVTAQINQGYGQTQMAIYGIPSVQTAYLMNWYASMHKKTSQTSTIKLLWHPFANTNPLSVYVTKEVRGLCTDGTSSDQWHKTPYKKFKGPGILKIQAVSSVADTDFGAGFDLILLDN